MGNSFDIIESIVCEILKDEGKRVDVKIGLETRLREDLGFDSLMLAVLTVKVEGATGVDVFEDGIVTTIGEIVEKTSR